MKRDRLNLLHDPLSEQAKADRIREESRARMKKRPKSPGKKNDDFHRKHG